MEDGVEPFQQLLDLYTQYFTIPQPIPSLPYVSESNAAPSEFESTYKFPGNSHDIYTEIVGSSHLTMTPAIDALPFPLANYDANSPHSYYM
jgi:hypothetical protein